MFRFTASVTLLQKKTGIRDQKMTQKWGHYMTPIFGGRVPLPHCCLCALQAWGRTTSVEAAGSEKCFAAWPWWAESGSLPGANLEASVRVKRRGAVDRQRVAAHGVAPSRTLGCILPWSPVVWFWWAFSLGSHLAFVPLDVHWILVGPQSSHRWLSLIEQSHQ